MKPTTNAEIEAFHGSEQKYLTLSFSDGTTIQTEDIVEESLQYTQSIDCGGQLEYAAGCAAQIRVGVFATTKHYKDLQMTVTIRAGQYSRKLGVFTIDSDHISSDGEYRELIGYDALSLVLQKDFSDWHNHLEFPMTVQRYRNAFAQAAGLQVQSATLINDTVVIEKNFTAQGYSGKDVLDAICQINACFAIVNSDGDLQFIHLASAEDGLYPSNTLYPSNILYPRDWGNPVSGSEYDLGSLSYEEYSCDQITGVQIRMSENDVGAMAGTSENVYVIQDNPLMYGKTTTQLEAIATTLLSHVGQTTYTPASLTVQASPWFELGDAISVHTKTQVITSLILNRVMSGITALTDTYSATGEKTREENTNSTSKNIEALKRFQHQLVLTNAELSSRIESVNTDLTGRTETLSSRITQLDGLIETEVTRATNAEFSLSSRVTQTENGIAAEVTRATNAERSVMADYSGSYVPTTSNSPASGWTTDAQKAQHIGEIFRNPTTGKYYVWRCDGIKIKFDGRSATESPTSFDNVIVYYQNAQGYQASKKLGGHDANNNIAGTEIFVPASTAYVRWYSDSSAVYWGWKIDSITTGTGKPAIDHTESSLPASVTDVISGVSNLPETAHPYTNGESRMYQINTGLTAPGFRWVEAGTTNSDAVSAKLELTAEGLTSIVENSEKAMSSQIVQTSDLIATKVSKGDVSSEISQEAGLITITSNRLVINSNNFTLDRYGNVTASNAQLNGSLTTESGSKKATLTGGGLTFYYGGSWTGELYAGNGYLSLSANELWINGTQVQDSDSCYVRASNGQVMSIGFETGFFKGYSLSGDTHNIVADLDYYWLNDIVTNLSIDFGNQSANWNWDSAINNLSWNNLI